MICEFDEAVGMVEAILKLNAFATNEKAKLATAKPKKQRASSLRNKQTERMGNSRSNIMDPSSVSSRKHSRKSFSCTRLQRNLRSLEREGESEDKESILEDENYLLVTQAWQRLYGRDGVEEELGEHIVNKMSKLEPNCKEKLGLSSTQDYHDRFSEICTIFVEMIDIIVTVLGGNLKEFQLELLEMGVRCQRQGIDLTLLTESLVFAFEQLLPKSEFPESTKQALTELLSRVIPNIILLKGSRVHQSTKHN